jgi:Tfp pilus assembly protein PilN
MKAKAIAVVWPIAGEWRIFRFTKRNFRWQPDVAERVEMPAAAEMVDSAEEASENVRRLRAVLQRPLWRGLPILLVVERPRYLFGELLLPQVPGGRLTTMIPFQLEKAFPFPMEDLWFSHLDPVPSGEGIVVPLFAAPNAVAGDLISLVEQAGGSVVGLLPSGWLWALRLRQRGPRENSVMAVARSSGTEIITVEGGALSSSVWLDAASGGETALAAARGQAARLRGALAQRQEIGGAVHAEALAAGSIPPMGAPLTSGEEADALAPLLALCLPNCPAVMTPTGRIGSGNRQESWKLPALLGGALLLTLVFGVIQGHLRDKEITMRYLEALRGLEPQAVVSKGQEERRVDLSTRSEALDKALGSRPGAREVLLALTTVVPLDTWLTEFTYQDGRVTIKGYSGNASVLLGALDGSPLFKQVRFGAPITPDARSQKDVFLIQAELEGGR